MTGVGGSGGLRVGRVAAAGHYLKFSAADRYEQEFDFERARVTLQGRTDASLSRLAKETGIGIRTFQRSLRRMVDTGAAWVERRFDPRTGRQTTSRIHLNQGWKRHPRTYRRNVSGGDSPRHSGPPPPQWHPPATVAPLEVSTS